VRIVLTVTLIVYVGAQWNQAVLTSEMSIPGAIVSTVYAVSGKK